MSRCLALVPAAGGGSRMGADRPKQYLDLAGAPLPAHTLRRLLAEPRLARVLVVLARTMSGLTALTGRGTYGWKSCGSAGRHGPKAYATACCTPVRQRMTGCWCTMLPAA